MKKYIAFILFIMLISCSSNPRYLPKAYNFNNQKTYSKDYDKVWRAISDFLANNGLSPNNIDKDSGFIDISGSLGQNYSTFCDCGTSGDGFGWFHSIDYPIWRTTISVTKIDDSTTKVKVNTFFNSILRYNEMNFNNNQYYEIRRTNINCNSNGYFENQILNYVEVFN